MSQALQKQNNDSLFSMIKLGLILACYAVVSCTVLALINTVTAPIIAKNQQKKANDAMRAVFTQAEELETVDDINFSASGGTVIDKLVLAKSNGKVIGAIVQATGPTYDHSTIMVGMDIEGTITGMQYLENTDTPGFGQKGSDPTYTLSNGKTFYGQFTGKNAKDGFILGVTFDAIAGATITSKGIGVIMEQATACMSSVLEAYK